MKRKSKLTRFGISTIVAFMLLGTIPASAEETYETTLSTDTIVETSVIDVDQSERGVNYPTQVWDLSDGTYGEDHGEESGGYFYPLYGGHYTYTSYKFITNTGKISVDLSLMAQQNYTNERRVSVTLYEQKKGESNWMTNSNKLFSFTPDEHNIYKSFSNTFEYDNLSSDYYYCVRFYNSSPGWPTASNVQYYSFDGEFSVSQ